MVKAAVCKTAISGSIPGIACYNGLDKASRKAKTTIRRPLFI